MCPNSRRKAILQPYRIGPLKQTATKSARTSCQCSSMSRLCSLLKGRSFFTDQGVLCRSSPKCADPPLRKDRRTWTVSVDGRENFGRFSVPQGEVSQPIKMTDESVYATVME